LLIPNNWKEIIKPSKLLLNALESLDWSHVLPSKDRVLRAFSYFNPEETRVIIIAQDPYPNRKDACGLAFSSEDRHIPASLKNIYKELINDLDVLYPNTANLEPWAKQGVLLLNSVLTVQEGISASHAGIGWEELTTDVIRNLLKINKPLVIIAWGNYAKNKLDNLPINDKIHKVLTGSHPSPLSAYNGFFNQNYFSKTNEWLKYHGIKEINWVI
jgi:uracil-DNA glycosylase